MPDVICCDAVSVDELSRLLHTYNLDLQWVADEQPIPGSHFGDPEAGLIENRLYVRRDTPLHSLLHEACHYICMDDRRRQQLHTDAGGDYDEENAVCYLSILLADSIRGFGAQRMMQDMDSWGYTFRLGSAHRWFEEDAEDALDWLQSFGIVDQQAFPSGQLRTSL
ncbi:MAG: hypothetical protein OQL16_02825 [Gammaproteobacteria bacterium]|nr:hypothetical protein [Gammaproteobacteria bacterium]